MLEIVAVAGPAWIQDLGRPGHMHEGMPWGGALVPELLLAANATLGNPVGAAGIEFYGSVTLRCSTPMALERRVLEAGVAHQLRPAAASRVGYVAIAGGVDVPLLMGGRGTFPAGKLGGYEGRTLRAGDVLPLGDEPLHDRGDETVRGRPRLPNFSADIAVSPGPDTECFEAGEWQRFLHSTWRLVDPSDRSGTRLQGPNVRPRIVAHAASAPMVAGAIQVPPSGQPVVLGPDHPVTGGYPVIAVVAYRDLGALHGRRIGAKVRFRLGE